MIRTLIIEDEPAIRKYTESLLLKYPDILIIGSCGSVAEAKVLLRATNPDLVLMDIELSDGNGFDLLQGIDQPIPFHIIFITAYNEFAIRAIKYGALDYLLKPIDEEELRTALGKIPPPAEREGLAQQLQVAGSQFGNGPNRSRIVLRSQQFLQIVPFENILYCQSDAGYTTFFFTDGKKLLVSKSIKEYEELLPEALFIRCHQSYLVNHFYIDRYHKDGYLILRNGTEIPVSTRKRDYVLDFLTSSSR